MSPSPRLAMLVGIWAGSLLLFVAPLVDEPGMVGSIWLVVCVVGVGVPANLFVFGVPREERIGLWFFRAAVMRRVGCLLLSAGAMLALGTLIP